MRKTLLYTTALLSGLTFATAASAQNDLNKSGVKNLPGEPVGAVAEPIDTGAPRLLPKEVDAAPSRTPPGEPVGAVDPFDKNNSFRSYMHTDDFDGQIVGGYTRDELIGAELVDRDGEVIGEIADLLIDANNEVKQVMVDVGGFLGIGERRVALDITEFTRDGDRFRTSMTEEQLEAKTGYEFRDNDKMYLPFETEATKDTR